MTLLGILSQEDKSHPISLNIDTTNCIGAIIATNNGMIYAIAYVTEDEHYLTFEGYSEVLQEDDYHNYFVPFYESDNPMTYYINDLLKKRGIVEDDVDIENIGYYKELF